jgi:hypothetical protein
LGAEPAEQDFTPANDHGQQVIEIMSDTAGKPSDRFHLVRALNLTFQPFSRVFGPVPLGNLAAKHLVGAGKGGRSALYAAFEFVGCALPFERDALVLADVADVEQ